MVRSDSGGGVVTDKEVEHRWLGYENPATGRFVAVCSCGWRSSPYPSAGLAGSACDHHRAEAAADVAAEDDVRES